MEVSTDIISIVIPCYNEEEVLPLFYEDLCHICRILREEGADTEIWFIDDGSKDGTLRILRRLAEQAKNVHYLSFSRNFGKEAAIYAGLKASKGNFTVLMDADFQDPPRLLLTMYHRIKETGAEIVAAKRIARSGEPAFRSMAAKSFYRLFCVTTKLELKDGTRDFRLMRRQVVDAILMLPEYSRFSKGIFNWIGFETIWIEYENEKRMAGKTKWSLLQLFKYAMDGITGFTTAPLMLALWLGIFICAGAGAALLTFAVRWIVFRRSVSTWLITTLGIMIFCGLQLFCIGILGQYLAGLCLEAKRRPLYIVRERDEKENETSKEMEKETA